MISPALITSFLRHTYPNPPPNPAWVTDCIAALVDDGQPATRDTVHEQYIYADLGASTLPPAAGSGLPTAEDETRFHTGQNTLFPNGLLVQLHSIHEIGASASALTTTLETRRDIISGQTRIRRMGDEDDEDADVQVGKLPAYPRSMLALEVGDGRTVVRAIEYRRIAGLGLGETPLGCKLLIRNVRCLRGTLLLSPENCTIIGGAVDELEAGQPQQFVAKLEDRLNAAREGTAGRPGPPTRRRAAPRRAPAVPAAAVARPVADPAAARAARLAAIQSSNGTPEDPIAVDGDSTFADDSFEIDDAVLLQVDAVAAAAAPSAAARPSPGRGLRARTDPGGAAARRAALLSAIADKEVIEISDSD